MSLVNFTYAGRTVRGCSCLKQWLPVVTALAVKRGLIKSHFDIVQGSYNTSVGASAGTHAGGGALDCLNVSLAEIRLMRECGGFASDRLPSEGPWGRHNHVVLVDCPHLSASAKRQIVAYRAGRNGLANNRTDRGPRVTIRSWRAGLAWAREQLNPTPKPAPKPAGRRTLRRGSTGEDVRQLQAELLRCFPSYAGHIRDSGGPNQNFGPATEAVIRQFQKRARLAVDGVVGPKTYAALARHGVRL